MNAKYFAFPSELLAHGADEIRKRHIVRFEEPDLFGKLISRSVVGEIVVDYETFSRTFADGPGEVDAICIYEVKAGKIAKAWFKRLHRSPQKSATLSPLPPTPHIC